MKCTFQMKINFHIFIYVPIINHWRLEEVVLKRKMKNTPVKPTFSQYKVFSASLFITWTCKCDVSYWVCLSINAYLINILRWAIHLISHELVKKSQSTAISNLSCFSWQALSPWRKTVRQNKHLDDPYYHAKHIYVQMNQPRTLLVFKSWDKSIALKRIYSEIPLLGPPNIKTFYPLKTLVWQFKLFFSSFSTTGVHLIRDHLWDCPKVVFKTTFGQSQRWSYYRNFTVLVCFFYNNSHKDDFYDVLEAFLYTNPLQKRGLFKEESCPSGHNSFSLLFFFLRIETLRNGRKKCLWQHLLPWKCIYSPEEEC